MLIGQPFSFRHWPDDAVLRQAGGHVNSRLAYVTLLVSLLYSTRKNFGLCQLCVRFVAALLRLELVRVDYLISKSGMLQVLFNLLRFFSEAPTVSSE